VSVCVSACVCVRVCVWVRESVCVCERVCVGVSLCETERERVCVDESQKCSSVKLTLYVLAVSNKLRSPEEASSSYRNIACLYVMYVFLQ
jgi:hypothetical protein